MVLIPVLCLHCKSDNIKKFGESDNNKQRYYCKNNSCQCKIFIIDYDNIGWHPKITTQIIYMTLNGSGIRDISRVLGVITATVISKLKAAPAPQKVNSSLLEGVDTNNVIVDIQQVDEAELDEMWSFVGNKKQQRWGWADG